MSKKYKLDKPAETKLSDVLAKYGKDRRREYIEELDGHLGTSARPSAMVMMLLKKLGTGEALGPPGKPAPGSYEWNRQEEHKGGNQIGAKFFMTGFAPLTSRGSQQYRATATVITIDEENETVIRGGVETAM